VNVVRTYLVISDDSLGPNEITSKLGLSPTTSRRKGEKIRPGVEGSPVAKSNLWSCLLPNVDQASLEASLLAISDRIDELGPILRKWSAAEIRFDVVVSAAVVDEIAGVDLGSRLISQLSSVGAAISFEFRSDAIFEPL
jgi:hypothetical protein